MTKTSSIVVAALVAAVIGCATTSPPVPMRGSDVSTPDSAPAVTSYSEKVPGVGQPVLISRTFVGQPPMIPHTVEKYVPLSQEENACLECHITDELRGQKVPKISVSHLSKTAKRKDGSPEVDMTRFQCDSCHVPQADAKVLVESQFVGVTK